MLTSSEYDDIKIIPQPADKSTKWYTTIERIRDRLPSLEGQAGKILKVSASEESCEWAAGGSGGIVSFADIIGSPSDNQALSTELQKKADVASGSSKSFTLGCDDDGLYLNV